MMSFAGVFNEGFSAQVSDSDTDNNSEDGSTADYECDHVQDNSISGITQPIEALFDGFGNVSLREDVFAPVTAVNDNVRVEEEVCAGELSGKMCNCTDTTQGEVLLMVLSLGLRHSLSYKAMVGIFSLINKIFKRKAIPATYYSLLKYAEPKRSQEHIHPLCSECNDYIGQSANVLGSEAVECDCGFTMKSPLKAKNFVMTLGMKQQIKELFESPDVAGSLNYRFDRQKLDDSALEDVYDGALYRKMCEEGKPLSDKNNFSYSFNTDGVPFGKTSYQQMWPIYIALNELEPKLRAKHMLMVGIWVGKSEPNMQVILQPFVNEANELSTDGIEWTRNGQVIVSKVIPLFSVVDTQARWRMLNHKCFGSYFGCTYCENPGTWTRRGIRFGMLNNIPPDRSDCSLRDCMFKGYLRRNLPKKKDRHFKGSKGPCALINLKYFDLYSGMPPDSMHFLKGCVEQNLNLILAPLNEDDKEKISKRLEALRPPSALTRLPRSLKYREKFTASEHRAFLLFYGPVVMHGIVATKLLSHFALLSGAMFLLMQKSISHAQIEYAGKLLVLYVTLYEIYYGTEYMTYNIHLLLHTVNATINLGPSWTHTCYPFEGKNRYLLQLAKSPLEVAKGVARRYAIFKNLPNLCDRFNVSDEVLNFCSSMFFKPLRSIVRSDNAVLLGNGKPYTLSSEEKIALLQQPQCEVGGGVRQFQRLVLGGFRLTSQEYHQSFRRDDSGIYLAKGVKCRIQNIVLIKSERKDCAIIFARILSEERDPIWCVNGFHVKHISRVIGEGQLVALRPSEIGGQCILLTTENGTYVTTFPYGCKGD